ncbi:MAG: PH domain-containing protein [Planctomycetota bacterium]|nr:PH domain-containing protein [Planctomycetota bacterium]
MSKSPEHQVTWIYEGIWGVLSGAFCVPREAPVLPQQGAELISARKPSLNYVRYLKFQLQLGMFIAAIPLIVGSLVLAAVESGWFLVLTVAIMLGLCFIGLITILAIHLRYDTMWYVFSDRSMRLRRGIWVIRESTITFENIQNVKVIQGPLQRWYGIADVVVETAGGGGAHGEHGGGFGMHSGVIEGVADATAIRDAIMNRVRMANTAGLGDESHESLSSHGGWSASHIAVLREIRDLANQATAT